MDMGKGLKVLALPTGGNRARKQGNGCVKNARASAFPMN